jgi:methylenetetrahydrofolate dehydrogenase (NADP+)/methenyltetrahydrofolate cyclohydrolase
MVAEVLDGRACADSIETSLGAEMATLAESGITPHLAVIIVGNDPASHVYVGAKERACARLGIKSSKYELSGDATWDEVTSLVQELNRNDDVDGILVQSPLPNGMDELAISELINPEKDVDGFHPNNLGRLVQGQVDGLLPCTPHGVMKLLESAGVELAGKTAVVVGRSRIVGMPQALLLGRKGADATVTVVHSRSQDIGAICRGADILVAAVGRAEFIIADWVKPGSVVIDVGVNRVEDSGAENGYRLAGDVHPDVAGVAGLLSPVPGGVGPMTIVMLMANTITAAKHRKSR